MSLKIQFAPLPENVSNGPIRASQLADPICASAMAHFNEAIDLIRNSTIKFDKKEI